MKFRLFIGGNWEDSESEAVAAAEDAFEGWAETPAPQRAEYILKAGELHTFPYLFAHPQFVNHFIERLLIRAFVSQRAFCASAFLAVLEV